jgi:hypothetical protein
MKSYLCILLLVCFLVYPVCATTIRATYQQPEDFMEKLGCVGNCTWYENPNGGNSYMQLEIENGHCITWTDGYPMIYTAATIKKQWAWGCGITPYEAGFVYSLPYPYDVNPRYMQTSYVNDRVEVNISDGYIRAYSNGVLGGTIGSAPISTTPSYLCIGGWLDDIVWSDESTGSRYIFGMPDQGYWTGKQYFLMKDPFNPSANGFYRVNTTVAGGAPTKISATAFTSTFGKNNGVNENVVLMKQGGSAYQTSATGSAFAGEISWDLTSFFASNAPYGLYVTTIAGQDVVSDPIPYVMVGNNDISVLFDKDAYVAGETATLSTSVSDAYFNQSQYTYRLVIMSIYGTEVVNTTPTFSGASVHNASTTYIWDTEDSDEIYYGLLYAANSTQSMLLNYDTCTVKNDLSINGYVFDAETEQVIPGAKVNISQGGIKNNLTTGTDGFYITTAEFVSDSLMTLSAGKTGYETYGHSFTPLYDGSIQINLTLMPDDPVHSGIALGGIAREPPYNRTISGATVTILNGTTEYIATTNSVGYYIQNNMPNNNWWNIWGSKIPGYDNSSIYFKLVFGS